MTLQTKLAGILGKIKEKSASDKSDYSYSYSEKLEKILPNMVGLMPTNDAEKYLEVIEASLDSKSSNVGTYILAEQIPKQIGVVKYDEKGACEPLKIQDSHKDFYFEVALKVAKDIPEHDHDILRNLPNIIRQQGPKTKKIIKTALKIKDEDFPGECNVVLLYTGMKAGYTFGGNEEDHQILVSEIEHKYLGTPLMRKRTLTDESANDFLESLNKMNNPRERRGFINSFYSDLKKGQLSKLNAKSIDNIATTLEKYGFENHANKLLNSTHYKNVKDYDDTIEKHVVTDSNADSITAVYQTKNTRKLDSLFGLQGDPLQDDEARKLISPSMWIGRTEQEIVMPRFARVAGKLGHFVGLPINEAAKFFNVRKGYIDDCVKEGYLEKFEHEGIIVVAPTDKYQPMDFSWVAR